MSVGSRVKEIRKTAKLSQTAFGKRLGVSIDVIANIEHERLARPEQKEPMMKLISKEFNISYNWLMTGEGEMRSETKDTVIDELAREYNLSDYGRKTLELYLGMSEEQKTIVYAFMETVKTVLSAGSDSPVDDTIKLFRSTKNNAAKYDAEIAAEISSYADELQVKKTVKGRSSASQNTKEA